MESEKQEVRVEGRIAMHLSRGVSKIEFQLGGVWLMEVRTEEIPLHLRRLGTRVLLVFKQGDQRFKLPTGQTGFHYDALVITDLPPNVELGWVPSVQ
jgi:hypothetical protein